MITLEEGLRDCQSAGVIGAVPTILNYVYSLFRLQMLNTKDVFTLLVQALLAQALAQAPAQALAQTPAQTLAQAPALLETIYGLKC